MRILCEGIVRSYPPGLKIYFLNLVGEVELLFLVSFPNAPECSLISSNTPNTPNAPNAFSRSSNVLVSRGFWYADNL